MDGMLLSPEVNVTECKSSTLSDSHAKLTYRICLNLVTNEKASLSSAQFSLAIVRITGDRLLCSLTQLLHSLLELDIICFEEETSLFALIPQKSRVQKSSISKITKEANNLGIKVSINVLQDRRTCNALEPLFNNRQALVKSIIKYKLSKSFWYHVGNQFHHELWQKCSSQRTFKGVEVNVRFASSCEAMLVSGHWELFLDIKPVVNCFRFIDTTQILNVNKSLTFDQCTLTEELEKLVYAKVLPLLQPAIIQNVQTTEFSMTPLEVCNKARGYLNEPREEKEIIQFWRKTYLFDIPKDFHFVRVLIDGHSHTYPSCVLVEDMCKVPAASRVEHDSIVNDFTETLKSMDGIEILAEPQSSPHPLHSLNNSPSRGQNAIFQFRNGAGKLIDEEKQKSTLSILNNKRMLKRCLIASNSIAKSNVAVQPTLPKSLPLSPEKNRNRLPSFYQTSPKCTPQSPARENLYPPSTYFSTGNKSEELIFPEHLVDCVDMHPKSSEISENEPPKVTRRIALRGGPISSNKATSAQIRTKKTFQKFSKKVPANSVPQCIEEKNAENSVSTLHTGINACNLEKIGILTENRKNIKIQSSTKVDNTDEKLTVGTILSANQRNQFFESVVESTVFDEGEKIAFKQIDGKWKVGIVYDPRNSSNDYIGIQYDVDQSDDPIEEKVNRYDLESSVLKQKKTKPTKQKKDSVKSKTDCKLKTYCKPETDCKPKTDAPSNKQNADPADSKLGKKPRSKRKIVENSVDTNIEKPKTKCGKAKKPKKNVQGANFAGKTVTVTWENAGSLGISLDEDIHGRTILETKPTDSLAKNVPDGSRLLQVNDTQVLHMPFDDVIALLGKRPLTITFGI